MATSFILPFGQYVEIRYRIVLYTNADKHYFVTRVKVDGRENIDFRCHTGYTRHHVCSYVEEVWMEKGRHSVTVEYRLSNPVSNLGLYDCNIALFKVKYHEPSN